MDGHECSLWGSIKMKVLRFLLSSSSPPTKVNKEATDKMRTFKDGKLKVNPHPTGDLMPWAEGAYMSGYTRPEKLFAAGDPRANQDFVLLPLFCYQQPLTHFAIIIATDGHHEFIHART